MITEITVNKLYGVFDHHIKLKDNNITLIIGENGLGKTIILKMIKSIFDNNFYELGKHDFTFLSILLDDNSIIEISKKNTTPESSTRYRTITNYVFEIHFKRDRVSKIKKTNKNTFNLKSETIQENFRYGREPRNRRYLRSDLYHLLKSYLPIPIDRVGPDRVIDLSNGKVYNFYEMIEKYSYALPSDIIDLISNESIPEWFTSITKNIKVKLIETQRLLTKQKSDDSEYKNAVIQCSDELKGIIRTKTLEATNFSSKLDRTYTNRLVQKVTSKNNTTISKIEESLGNLEEKRNFLIKVGLLEMDEEAINSISNINQNKDEIEILKDVLEIYIDDSNDKLKIYDELSEKLNTLIEIINKRFNYKTLSINKHEGFIFNSTITKKIIPLSNLSSGEQHELVLFYELLFNTPSNSIILIDEPEISLHISWQNEFINDVKEIININDVTALIATHSPDIINDNWDLTIQLG
ncbi:AAA family ATPase [Epilithonimonas hungarica]|uniref:Predicted ATP-binding protein involved in virulence n=1 Tax=Epilithonimonas hungarica TaxID=454006 RepID=A0A1G7IAE5_9FLAO|nr:AAA family ATPase [Epilithonimonas hungarica]SDF09665.1 Predicted ATP-binding protein involved in virulence [Epilithonimonas hungarica]